MNSDKTLHMLRTPPCETVERFIDHIASDECATVVCLYGDDVSRVPVDWDQLVEDIFAHQRVICWW